MSHAASWNRNQRMFEEMRRIRQPHRRAPARATIQRTAPQRSAFNYRPFLDAMRQTQERAAADREMALGEIRGAREAGVAALAPWEQQIQELEGAPEAIGAREEGQIFEQARVPIEAGAQAQMREMGEGFAPGGFRQAQIAGVMAGRTGQLAEVRRKTGIRRAERRRGDRLDVMRQRAGFGRTIADIHAGGARSLAGLYGQTIAAVPTLPPPFGGLNLRGG